jgi:hypothetical protein
MSKKMTGVKKATALMLVATVGIFQSLLTGAAMAQVSPSLAGNLSVRGSVMLNGVSVSNGATVFDGGQIKTASNGTAIISLGRMGQVELAADSDLVLKLDGTTIGGNLRTGRVTVSAPTGVGVNILTADGVAVAEGKDATVLSVDVTCGTRVMSSRNEAKVTSGNRVEIVAAGQEVAVGTPQVNVDPQRCPRIAIASGRLGGATALSGGALAALVLLGLGGAVAGVIAATSGDDTNANVGGTLSVFRP